MKICLVFIAILITSLAPAYSQSNPLLVDEKLNIDSFYANKGSNLIFAKIIEAPSLSKGELVNKVKNWAGRKFVNLKEVLVSETEDQLVLNYIDQSYYIKSLGIKTSFNWWIRLIIQFKDGKVKCSYFDDGNVYEPSTKYGPGIPARSLHFERYFKEKDGMVVAQKAQIQPLLDLRESLENNCTSIKDAINEKQSKGDW